MLLDHKKLEHVSINLEFHGAELKDASRKTAEVTGAFGYMDYAEVEKYASVYGLQEQFHRAQERMIESFVGAFSGVALLNDPERASAQQVEQWKAHIAVSLATLVVDEQVGRQLQKRYQETLGGR